MPYRSPAPTTTTAAAAFKAAAHGIVALRLPKRTQMFLTFDLDTFAGLVKDLPLSLTQLRDAAHALSRPQQGDVDPVLNRRTLLALIAVAASVTAGGDRSRRPVGIEAVAVWEHLADAYQRSEWVEEGLAADLQREARELRDALVGKGRN